MHGIADSALPLTERQCRTAKSGPYLCVKHARQPARAPRRCQCRVSQCRACRCSSRADAPMSWRCTRPTCQAGDRERCHHHWEAHPQECATSDVPEPAGVRQTGRLLRMACSPDRRSTAVNIRRAPSTAIQSEGKTHHGWADSGRRGASQALPFGFERC